MQKVQKKANCEQKNSQQLNVDIFNHVEVLGVNLYNLENVQDFKFVISVLTYNDRIDFKIRARLNSQQILAKAKILPNVITKAIKYSVPRTTNYF